MGKLLLGKEKSDSAVAEVLKLWSGKILVHLCRGCETAVWSSMRL